MTVQNYILLNLNAYENSFISLGQVSKLLEISQKESLKLISSMGIAVIDYSFKDDLNNMDMFIN